MSKPASSVVSSRQEPGEVSSSPSPGSHAGRINGIKRILAIIESLEGTPDRSTVIEDERKNLEAFLSENNGPESDPVKAQITATLK